MTNVDASVESQAPATQQKTLRGRPVAPSMARIVLKRLQIKMTERGFRRIEDLKTKTEALSAADVVMDRQNMEIKCRAKHRSPVPFL
jgi:hypothetical protein